ncbi:hypothetical protein KGY73_06175 [bacterium]|nr:hypothetical protein [bacterium]
MKRLIYVFAVALLSFALLFSGEDFEEGKPLKIEASVKPWGLYRGQEGKVVLKLEIREGITINPQPSFIVELDETEELTFPKNFFTSSDLEMEIIEKNGEDYLNLDDPLEIPFTVKLDAPKGKHTLEGKIKYFACSREEKWCLKTTSPFKVSFYTRGSTIKKSP